MVAVMGGIGLIASFLIVSTYQLTKPIIDKNKAYALEQAIFQVVPNAEKKVAFAPVDGKLQRVEKGQTAPDEIYACYDGNDKFCGVAVEATGQGFQDLIVLLYGYSPEKNAIVGMTVLDSKETPGLGDKITRDPDFLANFDNLDVKLNAAGDALEHPIELAKHGTKNKPYQIDAISGATISSRAVTNIIRGSTDKYIPLINKNLQTLRSTKP